MEDAEREAILNALKKQRENREDSELITEPKKLKKSHHRSASQEGTRAKVKTKKLGHSGPTARKKLQEQTNTTGGTSTIEALVSPRRVVKVKRKKISTVAGSSISGCGEFSPESGPSSPKEFSPEESPSVPEEIEEAKQLVETPTLPPDTEELKTIAEIEEQAPSLPKKPDAQIEIDNRSHIDTPMVPPPDVMVRSTGGISPPISPLEVSPRASSPPVERETAVQQSPAKSTSVKKVQPSSTPPTKAAGQMAKKIRGPSTSPSYKKAVASPSIPSKPTNTPSTMAAPIIQAKPSIQSKPTPVAQAAQANTSPNPMRLSKGPQAP
eukprot:CAMPEP_0206184114 /NCGR_PEP_ID=MMETSP0166-20121206/1035_1 /ASSEMBLY_ACC=CAM_ASM_000260 /TAXON_ID=95228 /ORGANISM="Vannella robusta, Strain DIVA3 518/3/11/1/6" /LENGTH=323 /DNA_ID=CAMNT_0053599087 /DNA_START=1 /DNA_END=968 /DNA_ORIENTATION=+